MSKYAVITTFNSEGYRQYAQKFIQTYLQKWPSSVTLYVYAEDCHVFESGQNLVVRNLHESSQDLVNFKTKWRNVPKANGDISQDPIRSRRRDAVKGFKWDAIRFSHKVYSIFHCAEHCKEDILIWMDADMVCHNLITENDLDQMIPLDKDLCFLGRKDKFSECGLYSMNLRSPMTRKFLENFQKFYDDAENGIFTLEEWHDSFVFDAVRKTVRLRELDWTSNMITGEGHPLINSRWGAFLDHLKGKRKETGKSLKTDLVVERNELYWRG